DRTAKTVIFTTGTDSTERSGASCDVEVRWARLMERHYLIWIVLYYGALALLCCYGLHRYFMLFLFYKFKRCPPPTPARFKTLPRLTMQLPVYNEMYVVERLIGAICRLHYPKDRLQIQVLDDSTDESREIAARQVKLYRRQGFDIAHIV